MKAGPVEGEYVLMMNDLAKALDDVFNGDTRPRKTGFALLVFKFGDAGERTNYISNAKRADMLNAMKEFIARAEGKIKDSEQLQ